MTQIGIKIRALQAVDAGSYSCIAENIAGSISSNQVDVNIFTRPIIEPLPKFVTLPSGLSSSFSDISIQCSARGNPTPKVKWTNGNELKSQIGLGTSKLVTRKEGTYSCLAQSRTGTTSATVFVVSEKNQRNRFPPILKRTKIIIPDGVSTAIDCKPQNFDQFTRFRSGLTVVIWVNSVNTVNTS